MMLRRLLGISVTVVVVVLASACDGKGAGATAAGKKGSPVVATVNGKPITALELAVRVRPAGTPRSTAPDQEKQVLDAMIQQELEAQKAVSLGLDTSPAFLEELERTEAQQKDWRRKELSKLYRSQELLAKSGASDDDVKRFFDQNTQKVQTEFHLAQLPFHSRADAEAAQAALAQGKSFDELAAPLYPGVAPEQRPWENPALRYENVPKPWWPELERLEPGSVSGIISAPGEQYWILKLIEKKQNPAITFEVARPGLQTLLRARAFEERRVTMEKELREKASIEIVAPAPQVP
jgi:hypothetical protein